MFGYGGDGHVVSDQPRSGVCGFEQAHESISVDLQGNKPETDNRKTETGSREEGSMTVVNVKDLRGPFSDYAAEIVDSASRMSPTDAIRLVEIWDATGDQSQYLKDCAVVWDALESSQRLLPLGWFERTFRDVSWLIAEPRALHAIADAVSVTLVRDLVVEDVVTMLLSPWRIARATETAGV